MKITIAVPHYNRPGYFIDIAKNLLNDERVGEIVISDDASSEFDYNALQEVVKSLNSNKIKLYRNDKNMGSYYNKKIAVEHSSYDWVYILDSDNYLYEDSLDAVEWDPNVAYNPSGVFINGAREPYNSICGNLGHDRFCGDKIIEFEDVSSIMEKDGGFGGCLNCGNFFINREEYLKVLHTFEPYIKSSIYAADGIFVNYLWLISGNKMQMIPGLNYFHRVHTQSSWMNSANNSNKITERLNHLFNNKIKDFELKTIF